MSRNPNPKSALSQPETQGIVPGIVNPARIYSVEQHRQFLDSTQLAKLEEEFRSWARISSRGDVKVSRKRIVLMFLLIRYTGARLHEVLALNPVLDIDPSKCLVRYGNSGSGRRSGTREVQVSSELMRQIQSILSESEYLGREGQLLGVDPGHVRRKFYERAAACGFPQDMGAPNAIRAARAVELMKNNVPLPVVQRILGHSTPSLTASLVTFSDEDIHEVARHFIERESRRKTSARNTFFGKISRIRTGDIQSRVELTTLWGDVVTTVITNNSLTRMGLKKGSLVTAEVKAPWVILQKSPSEPLCSAENLFRGTVTGIQRGKLTTEFVVRIQDGTELCSLVTEESRRNMDLSEKEDVWVMFNGFAVILHVD